MVDAVPQVKGISLAVPLAFGTHALHACIVGSLGGLAVMFFAVLLDHGLLAHRFVVFVRLHNEEVRKKT